MYRVLSCIVLEHDLRYVAAAVVTCLLGSFLTLRLFGRGRRTVGLQRLNWLFLAGMIGGSTIWATHFVAMLGYLPGGSAAYEPGLTLLSLAIVIATTMAGLGIAAFAQKSLLIEGGGVILGLGVALMHYTGMAAYIVQGRIQWDTAYVAASLVLAAALGALTTNRAIRPRTRFCRYGSLISMILAVALLHFTGMAALSVEFDPRVVMPEAFLSGGIMSVGVLAIVVVLLALGASTYVIDTHSARQAVERYRHLSLHDPLTGLPNRAAFNEHLFSVVEHSKSQTERVAVLSFDLDRFKEINDVHGHAAGDAVLRAISERISMTLDKGKFIARVGGDEFVAVLSKYYSRGDALAFANKLLAEVCRPIDWNGQTLSVGSSIGIAVYPDNADNIEDLLAQADVAMYRAKSGGTNGICFYESSMDQAARERNALAMDMRAGLQKGEFHLYYQQQNDTLTSEVIGFEALLRWHHPTRGMVSPTEFIPIAEKTGFILELGAWVLRTACEQAAQWKNPLRIAVNVAPQQLADAGFPALVHNILLETGLSPARLELEITESGLIGDQQHALFIIRQLKNLGVKIAMDDYGTGYSSLSTLQIFPFDKIKIDRAFVDGVASNAQSAAIVRSTLILASSLDIPVLAEGVETEEHMAFLRKEGCLQVQGYLFSKPMPPEEISAITDLEPMTAKQPVLLLEKRKRAAG